VNNGGELFIMHSDFSIKQFRLLKWIAPFYPTEPSKLNPNNA